MLPTNTVRSAIAKEGVCTQTKSQIACEVPMLAPGQSLSIDVKAQTGGTKHTTLRIQAVDVDGDALSGVFTGPTVVKAE